MKKSYYSDYDDPTSTPWNDPDWPCLEGSEHFPEEAHEDSYSDSDKEAHEDTYQIKCPVCGLTVIYYDEDCHVFGYHIGRGYSHELESAIKIGKAEADWMIGSARTDIWDLCDKERVARLDLFGFVASGLARPDSEVDILVRFDDCSDNLFSRYFDLKEGLERILERSVVLVEERAVKNPYRKKAIDRDRKNIYDRRNIYAS